MVAVLTEFTTAKDQPSSLAGSLLLFANQRSSYQGRDTNYQIM